MAASVLNTERAIMVSVYVVRAFVKLRQVAADVNDVSRRIDELERRFVESRQEIRHGFCCYSGADGSAAQSQTASHRILNQTGGINSWVRKAQNVVFVLAQVRHEAG